MCLQIFPGREGKRVQSQHVTDAPFSNYSRSGSIDQIMQVNEKLKSELLTVIGSMEAQLQRVQDKRMERLHAERDAGHRMRN